ncbi:MAG: hypothetical protein DRN29_08965 [Thermoplasmata archaeon]|nr:MAG: hypothetical protein DRN29_08965 [Thermoplasmata archaeon]
MERKVIILLIAVLSIFLLAISLNELKGKKREHIEVELNITPPRFSIQEGKSREIEIELKVNNMPYVAKINWSIESGGNTGKLVFKNESFTGIDGKLKAIYYAPQDVDEMEQKVKITAKVEINGKVYNAICNVTVYPHLYQTLIEIDAKKQKMIAGETNMLQARLFVFIDRWLPLTNKTVKWKFYVNNKTIEKVSKTDSLGITKIPFFFSNAKENISVVAEATFERNLSGEIDFDGCSANLSFNIVPEKPGDFPVVLIHGWGGNIADALLNFTWWNLTKKLIANGFKVLDFDITKPGIQWLSYEPGWFEEHHIPWIAARVCEKIQNALILNGYPPNQTIDIVAHSMGGLIARFIAEHYMADVDYWNKSWNGIGYPWYGDGDADITISPFQIDDLIVIGTPCHGVPPNINESLLRSIIRYAYFPWWIAQVPDMIYGSPFLEAMGYEGTDLVDYYGIGGDIGFGQPVDFDGDGIAHRSDGLCPAESPYLEGRPLYILEGAAWPVGKEDHMSLIAINDKVHEYIIQHLIN